MKFIKPALLALAVTGAATGSASATAASEYHFYNAAGCEAYDAVTAQDLLWINGEIRNNGNSNLSTVACPAPKASSLQKMYVRVFVKGGAQATTSVYCSIQGRDSYNETLLDQDFGSYSQVGNGTIALSLSGLNTATHLDLTCRVPKHSKLRGYSIYQY